MLEDLLSQSPIIVQPYVRVSSEKQEAYSPEAQIEIAKNWCKSRGYAMLKPIVETGSGKSIETRPGITRALDMAEKGLYHIIWAVEQSRYTRKTATPPRFMNYFGHSVLKSLPNIRFSTCVIQAIRLLLISTAFSMRMNVW